MAHLTPKLCSVSLCTFQGDNDIVPLCIFQARTGSASELTKDLPIDSLFNVRVIVSVLGMAVINFGFQYYVGFYSHDKVGTFIKCESAENVEDQDPPCSLNTVIYLISTMQYLTTCLALSKSKPYR